jgi:hypothetical protein
LLPKEDLHPAHVLPVVGEIGGRAEIKVIDKMIKLTFL